MSKNRSIHRNKTEKNFDKKSVNKITDPMEEVIRKFIEISSNPDDVRYIDDLIQLIAENLDKKLIDVNARDENGDTLLMHVVGIENYPEKKLQLLKLLIDKGAKVDLLNSEGFAPLFMAVINCDLESAKFLINEGKANISKQTTGKDSLLKMAVNEKHFEIVKLLISNGADINAVDGEGRTILEFAIESQNPEIIGSLIDTGRAKLDNKFIVKNFNTIKSLINYGFNPYNFLPIRSVGKPPILEFVGIINDYGSLIAKNNDNFLKEIEKNFTEEGIKEFIKINPINFYVKDTNGKALISNLAEQYPENWMQILGLVVEKESTKAGIIKYQQNEQKQKDLKLTSDSVHDSLKPYLNLNNIDLLKVTVGENSQIKFESKDEILQEVMKELLQKKESIIPKNNSNQKNVNKGKNTKPSQVLIVPSKRITPEEIVENYIKKYCEKYKGSEEVKIDDLVNKINSQIAKEFGGDIFKFILNNPQEKIESIINPNAKIVEKESLLEKGTEEEIDTTKITVDSKDDKNKATHPLTKGGGNCLLHAIRGDLNENNQFEDLNHLVLRQDLVEYIETHLDVLMSHAPDSTRTPIAISILDHFLTTARTIKSSPEREYLDDKNNQNVFQEYETAGLVLDLTISEIIENDGEVIHGALMINGDLQNQLATILQKTPDYVINPANKDVVLKYILQNPALRNQVLNEDLQELRTSLDVADYNLHQATKAAILQTLNYYKDDGVWLTNDFAEIHAKKNGLNVIIHTGANEERVSKFLYNQNNLDEIIHIGIRNGEGGNHFEKIDNLDLWLEGERNEQTKRSNKFRDDYSLVESTATEIATQFLSYYELLSSKEKQDFCDNCIGGEQNSELLSVILQSMYGGEKNKLPDYLWEGIATELFYELAGRSGEFSVQRMASKTATDFQSIMHAGIDLEYTIPSLGFINRFANKFINFSRDNLDNFIENNPSLLSSKYTINSSEKFATFYGVRLVVENYKKEFIETKDAEFWSAYQNKFPADTDDEKNTRWKQYLIDRKEWMKDNFEIEDENNKAIVYQSPDFNKWKEEIINTLIFYVPEYIMGSIAKEEVAKDSNQKITLEQQGKIKNLNLNKLEEKNFAVLLSYALTTDEKSKEFLLEKIKSNMPAEEEQKAFLFKAELISSLIHEDKIPVSNIVSIFKERHEVKNKAKDQDKKDLSVSYQMKKPTEMEFQTYIAKVEDIMIPSRKNDNNLKVIFTDEVKAQIDKQGQSLKGWRDIADRGLVGAVGQSGIKNLKTANHLWELKTKEEGDLKGKRCYAIQKGDTLFVIGCGDKKSQDGDIEKYGKYEIELDHKKTINTSGSISPRNASRLNDKGLEASIALN